VVKVTFQDGESETFLIATRQQGISDGDGKLETYSPSSPLGNALIDAKVGDKVSYKLPNGSTMTVTLNSAEPYHT
jgi:transcription elongation factor GreA